MKPWLPPHRAELVLHGEELGDFIDVFGNDLLVSERFAQAFREEGFTGLEGFHPVEVVRVRRKRRGPKPAHIPRYLLVRVCFGRAAVDVARSRIRYVRHSYLRGVPLRWPRRHPRLHPRGGHLEGRGHLPSPRGTGSPDGVRALRALRGAARVHQPADDAHGGVRVEPAGPSPAAPHSRSRAPREVSPSRTSFTAGAVTSPCRRVVAWGSCPGGARCSRWCCCCWRRFRARRMT